MCVCVCVCVWMCIVSLVERGEKRLAGQVESRGAREEGSRRKGRDRRKKGERRKERLQIEVDYGGMRDEGCGKEIEEGTTRRASEVETGGRADVARGGVML